MTEELESAAVTALVEKNMVTEELDLEVQPAADDDDGLNQSVRLTLESSASEPLEEMLSREELARMTPRPLDYRKKFADSATRKAARSRAIEEARKMKILEQVEVEQDTTTDGDVKGSHITSFTSVPDSFFSSK
ncbi:unnamed protein product [Amoebophrya sp. A25]|nr:unnamed protein product [Amoebophrya sp. A25]|eukprot:GSA25T00027732001.1